jgi:PAS domain-containing protein
LQYGLSVETRRQKHLVLILAREFASNLATPTAIADDQGTVVFYNEAAEAVVGTPFAEAADLSLDEWGTRFAPRTESGPVSAEQLAGQVALQERRAVHERYRVTSVDGVERDVSVTAFPLFAQGEEFVGIVVIFWRE